MSAADIVLRVFAGITALAVLAIAYVAVAWWLEMKHHARIAAIAKIEMEANVRRARAMLCSGTISDADKASGQ